MWPWRRRTQRTVQRSTADAPAPDTREPTGTGPAAKADVPTRRRDEPLAWAGLPPIQRVMPDDPRLNLPEAFSVSLATWRDPSFLAPLGHLVGDAEPAGVLHGAVEPVRGQAGTDPEPAGQAPEFPAPLPLALPPADTRHPTPSLQRQVAVAPARGHRPAGNPPPAVPPRDRPVPMEPMPVSRLLTAPPPPVELRLPPVDRPTDAADMGGDTEPPSPTDAAPTLGRDDPMTGDPTPSSAEAPADPGIAAAAANPWSAAEVAGPVASAGTGPLAPGLPVQRMPDDAPRPPRRLGLGEPIVSPLLPPAPATRDTTAVGDASPMHRVPAGEDASPLVQRSPGGATGPVEADRAARAEGVTPTAEAISGPAAGQQDGGDGTTEIATTPADATAGLVGEVVMSRLGIPDNAPGPSAVEVETDLGPVGGAAPPAGGLPVPGPAGGRTSAGDTAPAPTGGDVIGSGTSESPLVQTYVPPQDAGPTEAHVVPLLGHSPASSPAGMDGRPNAAGPADRGGPVAELAGQVAGAPEPDRPVVSRLETPVPPASSGLVVASAASASGPTGGTGQPVTTPDHTAESPETGTGPDTSAPVGGYGNVDHAAGGLPGDSPAPVPLVVARLVGDRPARLLTGAVPEASVPAQPAVQRVTWQREAAPAPAAVPEPQRSAPSHLAAPHDLPAAAVHPGATGAFGASGASGRVGGHGPAPVQRWVGALPGSPPPPDPPGSGGGGPPVAYLGRPDPSTAVPGPVPPGPIVQRAESEAPPPVDAPGPPTAAVPPPGGGSAATGPPAAVKTAPAVGMEPEELLKKLYDPLLRRLKTELRLDRERHGVLGGPG